VPDRQACAVDKEILAECRHVQGIGIYKETKAFPSGKQGKEHASGKHYQELKKEDMDRFSSHPSKERQIFLQNLQRESLFLLP
jgi:hypothetical protein